MICQHVIEFFTPSIFKMSEHQQQFFPMIDIVKDCESFVILDH